MAAGLGISFRDLATKVANSGVVAAPAAAPAADAAFTHRAGDVAVGADAMRVLAQAAGLTHTGDAAQLATELNNNRAALQIAIDNNATGLSSEVNAAQA